MDLSRANLKILVFKKNQKLPQYLTLVIKYVDVPLKIFVMCFPVKKICPQCLEEYTKKCLSVFSLKVVLNQIHENIKAIIEASLNLNLGLWLKCISRSKLGYRIFHPQIAKLLKLLHYHRRFNNIKIIQKIVLC